MLYLFQPPSGGCVLKLSDGLFRQLRIGQPPSGGCVLKLLGVGLVLLSESPAAFGRLCVET